MRFSFLPAALSLWVASSSAQFVTTPTNFTSATGYAGINVRYKEVPTGICELDPNVKSYSGYADVADDQHIFFWFFEARNQDPKDAPLTVWINGGPGSTSMIGLFEENGPCRVDSNGKPYSNPYSWSNVSNMLYIDQPTQVGFSYSVVTDGYVNPDSGQVISLPDATCPDYAGDNCGTFSLPNVSLTANSTQNAAPNMWKTLQGFMGAFPQYSRNGFHFTTESYGGHYGPIFNEYFEEQNSINIPGAHKISLETVLIGNGWYDPLIQYQAYYNFTVFPGNTYDYSPYNDSAKAQLYNNVYGKGNCVDQLKDCYDKGTVGICATIDLFCSNYVESFLDNVLGRDEYDIRELTPDPFPYGYYKQYLNTAPVQAAIGAYQNFTGFSAAVGNAFGSTGDDARESGTIEALRRLLDQGINVVLFAGDADYNCNWFGGEVVSQEVKAPNFDKAGYTNITTSDSVVHGQVKQSGRFSFSRIYESGHEVPFYQPLLALEFFDRAIQGLDIATGKVKLTDDYITTGTDKSTYRQGISTVQFSVLPTNSTYNTTLNGPNPQKMKRDAETKRGKGILTHKAKSRKFKPAR